MKKTLFWKVHDIVINSSIGQLLHYSLCIIIHRQQQLCVPSRAPRGNLSGQLTANSHLKKKCMAYLVLKCLLWHSTLPRPLSADRCFMIVRQCSATTELEPLAVVWAMKRKLCLTGISALQLRPPLAGSYFKPVNPHLRRLRNVAWYNFHDYLALWQGNTYSRCIVPIGRSTQEGETTTNGIDTFCFLSHYKPDRGQRLGIRAPAESSARGITFHKLLQEDSPRADVE